MLDMEDWMEVKDLYRQAHSIRQICRLSGYSRNTVRKVLRHSVPTLKPRKQRASLLDEFKPYLRERYLETALSASEYSPSSRRWVILVRSLSFLVI